MRFLPAALVKAKNPVLFITNKNLKRPARPPLKEIVPQALLYDVFTLLDTLNINIKGQNYIYI